MGHVDRLHAEPIAAEQQTPLEQVERGERKLTAQPRDHGLAPPLERAEQRLRVAGTRELRAFELEFLAQRRMVVDLAVVGDPPIAARMPHRLVAALAQIDDRQSRMNQRNVVDYLDTRVIGSTVAEGVTHRNETVLVGQRSRPQHATTNSAHA